jgi:hypothetical protein
LNKAARRDAAARAHALAEIIDDPTRDPVLILLGFAADEANPPQFRAMCAAAAAPYCRPRLSAVAHSHAPRAPTDDARERIDALLERLAPPPAIEHQPADDNVVPMPRKEPA